MMLLCELFGLPVAWKYRGRKRRPELASCVSECYLDAREDDEVFFCSCGRDGQVHRHRLHDEGILRFRVDASDGLIIGIRPVHRNSIANHD